MTKVSWLKFSSILFGTSDTCVIVAMFLDKDLCVRESVIYRRKGKDRLGGTTLPHLLLLLRVRC
jgi:hypothetical protein